MGPAGAASTDHLAPKRYKQIWLEPGENALKRIWLEPEQNEDFGTPIIVKKMTILDPP